MESINNEDKTMIHISHLHPLKLIESPEPKPMCHACNMLCSNQSYGCIQCYYFLHITCATTKRTMDHPSHPAHTLKLELTPPYHNGPYGCDGCGVDGTSFCLRCGECSYDLHLPCAAIPHQVKHSSHPHQLTLVYENPYSPDTEGAFCNLCMKDLDVNKWFYLCTSCDFGGHVECFSPEKLEVLSPGLQEPHHMESYGAAQVGNQTNNLLELQLQLRRAGQANAIINAGHSLSSLA
ncbi:protein VACUOLELESS GAMETOPHYTES-like [Carex rostrata]